MKLIFKNCVEGFLKTCYVLSLEVTYCYVCSCPYEDWKCILRDFEQRQQWFQELGLSEKHKVLENWQRCKFPELVYLFQI